MSIDLIGAMPDKFFSAPSTCPQPRKCFYFPSSMKTFLTISVKNYRFMTQLIIKSNVKKRKQNHIQLLLVIKSKSNLYHILYGLFLYFFKECIKCRLKNCGIFSGLVACTTSMLKANAFRYWLKLFPSKK